MSPHSSRPRAGLTRGVVRKLEGIGQAMHSITTRSDLAEFLHRPENAQKFNGLIEDIRHALMGYHVRVPNDLLSFFLTSASDIVTKGYLQGELPEDCESRPYNLALV